MPALQLLIKPASGLCNMQCKYCFYSDITSKRETASYGIMTLETLEEVIKKALSYADYTCGFAFQGGEPTLAGLDFFKSVVDLQKKYNAKNLNIQNSIQTNGYIIDEEWCRFFHDNHFLVGLSVDGIKATHDSYRKASGDKDTFWQIMNAASLFKEMELEYNILTVVHRKTAAKVRKIYEFYKKNGFSYQQYIACLDPVFERQGEEEYSLTPEAYGEFLKELFDLWYIDLQWGRQPYIRQFENYVAILMGYQPESCEQRGTCGIQYVVEADGEVYPCDFYVLDGYKLGNLKECDFPDIDERRKEIEFIQSSFNHDEECRKCPYFSLCRGGCARHRTELSDREDPSKMEGKRNYFCQSYRIFFEHSADRLQDIAYKIKEREKGR